MAECKARREQDEFYCRACNLRWGADEDPPACRQTKQAVGKCPLTKDRSRPTAEQWDDLKRKMGMLTDGERKDT
jgi:hypothetical protein